jgi:hypothetical protein
VKAPVFYFIHKGQVQATKTFKSSPPFRPFLVKSGPTNSAADLSAAGLTASWPLLSYAAEHSASRATRTLPNPLQQFSHRVGRVLSVSPVVGIGTPPPL